MILSLFPPVPPALRSVICNAKLHPAEHHSLTRAMTAGKPSGYCVVVRGQLLTQTTKLVVCCMYAVVCF